MLERFLRFHVAPVDPISVLARSGVTLIYPSMIQPRIVSVIAMFQQLPPKQLQKRKRPRPIWSRDARRTALPRSLLVTRLRFDTHAENGTEVLKELLV